MLLGAAPGLFAQFTYSEDFRNSSAVGWVLNPAGNSTPNAVLTSGTAVRTGDPEPGPTIDPAGSGWLRLTNNTTFTHNAVYFDTPIPSAGNSVNVQFGVNLFGGNNFAGTGADGLTFFLYDASKSFQVGADGGSMGYAQKTGVNGLNGGFVAVALDAYGNFSVSSEGRVGGTGSLQPNSVVVRGPGQGQTGYNYLAGTGNRDLTDTGSPTTLDGGDGTVPTVPYTMAFGSATARPNQSTQYRNVSITLDENSQLSVSLQFGEDGLWYNLLNVDLSSFVRPEQLKMGFSAGTGSGTIITEVGGLLRIDATAGSGIFAWDNGEGTGIWGTGATNPLNWAGNTNPTLKSNVLFNSAYVSSAQAIDVTGSDKVITNMYFAGANAYTLTTSEARKLIFDATTVGGLTAINLTNDSGGNASHTLGLDVQMNRNLDINNNITAPGTTFMVSGNIDNGGNTLALKGAGSTAISGTISGSGELVKADAGTATLSGANTYSGGTTISGGTLRVENASALGATTGGVTVDSGASLALASSGGIAFDANALTLNGAGVNGLGALQNAAGNNTWTGGVTLATASHIGVAAGTELSVTGVIDGSGVLTKVGDGTLTLAGANTYTGATHLQAGTLALGTDAALGAAPVSATPGHLVLDGGTLRSHATLTLHANRGVSLGAGGGTIETLPATTLTYDGVIAGTSGGALNKLGGGTLTLGGASTYDGPTNINAGTLALGANHALPSATAVTVATGATFDLNSHDAAIGSLAGAGATNLGAGNILTISGATSTHYAGVISGAGGVTKAGSSTLTLSGTNTFTGALTLNAGVVQLGASHVFADAATLALNGGTFSTNGHSDRFSSLSLLGSSAIDYNSMGGALSFTTGARTGGGLTIANWAGSPTGGGASQFLVDSLTAFDAALLSNINFSGYAGGAQIIALGGGLYEVVPVTGASFTWGIDGSGTWSGNNWQGGVTNPGGIGTTTVFGNAITADRTVTLDAPRTVGYLVFNDDNNYTVSGAHPLTLDVTGGSAQLSVSGGGSATINTALQLNDALVVNQNSAGATLTLAGDINGTNRNLTVGGSDATLITGALATGSGSLTKLGDGTLTLASVGNTFTGAITVNGGVLAISDELNLGATASTANLTLNGGTLRIAGADVTVATSQRNLVLGASGGTIDTINHLTWDNGISGAGSLTKTGTGVLTLLDPTTFTGALNLNAGSIVFDGGNDRLADVVAVTIASGATLNVNTRSDTIGSLAGAGTLTNAGGTAATVTFGGLNTNTTFSGTITDGAGALNLVKQGSGRTVLSGANGYDGTTTVAAGTLSVQNDTALGTKIGGTTVLNGATLELEHATGLNIGAEPLALAGTGVGGNGALRNVAGTTYFAGDLTLNGTTKIQTDAGALTLGGLIMGSNQNLTLDTAGGSALTVQGMILTGAGTITKDGAGVATLSSANNYSGVTTVNAGTLAIRNNASLGSAAAGTTVANGATLAVSHNLTNAEVFNVTGQGVGSAGAIRSLSGNNTLSGAIAIGGESYFGVDAGNLTLAGVISGGFGVTKVGSGNLTVSGANSYTGTTAINGGTLVVSGAGTLGTSSAATTVADGATLALNNLAGASAENITVTGAGVGGAGSIRSIAGNNTLSGVVSLTGDTTIGVTAGTLHLAGNVTGGADLIKAGGGTLNLAGSANSYTGATTIRNGTLLVSTDSPLAGNGALGNSSSTVQIGDSGTATSDPLSLLLGNATGGVTVQRAISINNFNSAGTTTLGGTNTSGTNVFEGNVGLGRDTVLTSASGGTVAFNGSLSGSGAITATGAGTILLGGTNSLSGGATVNSGATLVAASSQALGATAVGTTVNSGGTLALQGGIALPAGEAISVAGTGVAGAGALKNLSGDNTVAGPVTLNANATLGAAAGTLTLSGPLAEAGGARDLTTTGAGNLLLTASSSLTGAVTIGGTGTTTLANSGGQVFGSISGITVNPGATLALGASNQINDAANLTLAGGTFSVGAYSETMRQLSQTSASAIDYLNDGSILRFNGVTGSVSGLGSLTGTLTINNWAGSLEGGGTEQFVVYSPFGTPVVSTVNFADWGSATAIPRNDLGIGYYELVPTVTATYWHLDNATAATWNNNSGHWSNASGTAVAQPNSAGAVVILGDLQTAGGPTPLTNNPIINVDGSGTARTIGKLFFENSADRNYTLNSSSGDRLAFDVSSGQTQIVVNDDGAHTINADIRNHDAMLVTNNSGAATGLTIAGDFDQRFTGNLTFNGAGNTLVSGAITQGTGTTNLVKTGSGALVLANAGNSYEGTTTLRQGTLEIRANSPSGSVGALGDASSAVLVNDAATTGTMNTSLLIGTSGVTVGRAINVGAQGATTTLGGNFASGSATFSGAITLDKSVDLTAAGAANVIFSGALLDGAGVTNITKTGTGTVTLASSANTYDGTTTVSTGTLRLGTANAIPDTSAVVVASGATFDLNGNSDVIGSLAGAGNVTGSSGSVMLTAGINHSSTTFSGTISDGAGTLALAKAGTGTLTLTGANTYDGATYVVGGTLIAAHNSALGSIAGNTTVASGATLGLQGGITVTGEHLNLAAAMSPSAASVSNLSGHNTWTGTISLTGGTANDQVKIDTAGGSQLTFSGAIGEATNAKVLAKTGAGTLVLSGANTYTGSTNVAAGTLVVAHNSALGSTIGDTSVQIGATLGIQNNVTVAAGESFTLHGTALPVAAPSLKNLAGTNTLQGGIVLSGGVNTGVAIDANTGALALNGAITQATHPNFIVKTGAADLTLGGSAGNTFSGGFTINDGRVLAAKSAGDATGTGSVNIGDGIGAASSATLQLNASNQINNSSAVTIATDGRLDLQGFSDSLGALTMSGGSVQGSGTATLGNNLTFNGVGSSTAAISANVNLGTSNLSGGSRIVQVGNNGLANDTDLTISGAISGTAGFVKTDLGTLALTGSSANTNSGLFQVSDGTVLLNKTVGVNATGTGSVQVGDGAGAAGSANLKLLASNQINDGSRVTVFGDGRFNVNGVTETIGSFAGTGVIDLGAGGSLIAGGDNTSTTFGGTFAGTGMVQKVGTGDLTFNASINFAGELRLTGGEITLAGVNLSVGTLRITGNTILDFGASSASTLTATNVIIDPGATLTITNWVHMQDYFFATGSFQQFGGLIAPFNQRGVPPQNQIGFTGWNANNTTWQSWDRQITPAPEPATYGAIMIGGALGLLGYRRWRKGAPTRSKSTSRG